MLRHVRLNHTSSSTCSSVDQFIMNSALFDVLRISPVNFILIRGDGVEQ